MRETADSGEKVALLRLWVSSGASEHGERLRGVLSWLQGTRHSQLRDLGPGEALAAFAESSDPRFTQGLRYLKLRCTATWAGGETFTAAAPSADGPL